MKTIKVILMVVAGLLLSSCRIPHSIDQGPYWPYDSYTNQVTFDDGTTLNPPSYGEKK